MAANFVSSILARAAAQPQQTLLAWPAAAGPARTYTGHDLAQRVAGYRQALAGQGVRPGQRVLLLLPVGFELICALLAVLAQGGAAVLPPAGVSAGGLLRLVRRGRVAVAIGPRPLRGPLGWLVRGLGPKWLAASRLPAGPFPLQPPQLVPPGQAALISHSSGSTGPPKQVVRSHQVLLAQHAVLKQIFPPRAGQRDFPLFPNVLLHNLSAGIASVLPALSWADLPGLDPARLVRQLAAEQVHTLTGNVFYFQRLLPALRAWPGGFPAVAGLGVGGSPVPERLLRDLQQVFAGAAVHAIYGSSEAEPIAVRQFTAGAPADPRGGYRVGPVQPSLACRLLPCGELLLPGPLRAAVGEITVRGPHVATAAADGWLRTGDFGYFDAAGELWLTGRQGNAALHQGVQHYQLEHVLQHLPGIGRVAARAAVGGFVVYFEGPATEAAIRQVLAAQFPPGLVTAIHRRPRLPVDQRHHSKIRYDQLR
ncbi:class I adenylate-forming enzyme family protein [Hymenobacter caeli]|uniref:Acyl-CoA synthetase (AMP-forming)/AMP-acid ligase II n=1 Tax=Hymenobacter caeli TaxID=2735894 RepID=A0ABX2FQ98_9BACT|nr:AMP-binding protein [Hymenobacter caeli]NRT18605.1 acyl-CoA synthetase (AMP-forming)/AMP-acid ligase II [Hymenobacter caeli]